MSLPTMPQQTPPPEDLCGCLLVVLPKAARGGQITDYILGDPILVRWYGVYGRATVGGLVLKPEDIEWWYALR